MGLRISVLLTCTWLLAGCFTRRTEEVPDPTVSDPDSAANGGAMDAASDSAASNGGQTDASTGGDSGAGANGNTDGGKQTCTKACDTPTASRCDGKTGKCAVCEQSKDCTSRTTTPACKAGEGCVECTPGDEALCTANSKVCANDGTTCVECNSPAECGDDKPVCSNHTCVKCTGATEDCMGRSNALCHVPSGSCVPCLAGQTTACAGKVCNLVGEKPVCSDQTPASADLCKPCVSDQQCQAGQLCIHMFWDNNGDNVKETDVGWFCQWKKNGGGAAPLACVSAARPYVGEPMGVASADQPNGSFTLCSLATSTCPAHNAYRTACGRFGSGATSIIVESRFDNDISGGPVAKELVVPDQTVCGVGGRCIAKNADDGAYQCSVACDSSNNDCPKGASTCGGAPPATLNICSVP